MTDRPAVPSGTDSGARGDASCWAFGPRESEIVVRNAELLLAHMPLYLSGWPFRRVPGDERPEAAIDIRERPDGRFAVAADGGEIDYPDAFEAADGLAGALVDRLVRQRCLVCVRAAAVQVGGRLVVLLGESLAGKSSVALHMAAAGHRLFAEGCLALRPAPGGPSAAVCLGLTPRVRLPLPDDFSPAFRDYVDSFTEMRSQSAALLKLWEGEAAGFLEEAPPAVMMELARRQSGPCDMAPAPPTDIAEALDAASSGSKPLGNDIVGGLASGIPGYRIAFVSSREAAAAIAAAVRAHHTGA